MDQSKHSKKHSDADHPAAHPGHETQDAPPRTVTVLIGGLAILTLVTTLAMWGLFKYFNARQGSAASLAVTSPGEPRLPPQPRLQVTPETDLETWRVAQEKKLTSYGWVNREAEIVHIPIDRAMDLIAERGLPVRTEDSEPQTESGEQSSEASEQKAEGRESEKKP